MTAMTLYTIFGMALVTYASRGGGYLIGDRLPHTGRMAGALKAIPGGVLIGIIIPGALFGGLAEALAAIAVAGVSILTRNLIAAMAVGVGVVWVLRQWT